MPKVEVNAEEIPDELKERDQWLMWDASADAPRRPHWKGNFSVSWTDPDDWHSFDEAVSAMAEEDSWGIGYVFSNTNEEHAAGVYGALDLDGCVDDGRTPKEWLPSLQPFFDEDAYLEYSPSGEGIHVPIVGFEPPSWWTDVHFSDDEHEGVEAYGKKFFTFTGDTLAGAGVQVVDAGEFVEDWLVEVHKAITGDDPTRQSSLDFDEVSEGGRRNQDEFLEEEDIREALEYIDPDAGYTMWRDIGFALANFFDSDRTALSVFTDWSRGGSKWDSDAQELAERIISDADSGGGRTIGTVIHHAKRRGWEMPTPSGSSRSTSGTAPSSSDTDDSTEDDEQPSRDDGWRYVRWTYEEEGLKQGRYEAARVLDEAYSWMYVVESETLWVYDEDRGYFNSWGREFANEILEKSLGTSYSKNEMKEIVARLEARHQTHREKLNANSMSGYHLCVGNGVIDLETGRLEDHDPAYKFTRGLQWDYEPAQADPGPVLDFLDEITKREADRDTLLDHLAHGLMPGHPYRAFVITYGPGSNGKTQLGKLLRGFVGEENAASVELQDLTGDDQFATGGLPGAFVNVGDDISVSEIRDVSILKSLTGAGTVRANEKYQKQYEFENEAAMFFSANEPPRISEESNAIGDRLYPIEMPYRFLGEDEYDPTNPNHKQKTTRISQRLLEDEAAMRGLLLLAVKHAQDLIKSDGQYSMPEGPRERRELYEAASDPIRRFALEHLEEANQGELILKDDAFAVYKAMCEVQDERVASADGFKRQIAQQALIDVESTRTRKFTPGDGQERAWRYVRFAESAKELMPPRLVDRYFDGSEEQNDTGEPEPEDAQVGVTTVPLRQAAEDPTGYPNVGAEVVKTAHPAERNEDAPALKATVMDGSTAMDVVHWTDPDALREGDEFIIENAATSQFDGQVQLVIDEDVSTVHFIERADGQPADDDGGDRLEADVTDPEAAADGGPGANVAESSSDTNSGSDTDTGPAPPSERDRLAPREAADVVADFLRDSGAYSQGVLKRTLVEDLSRLSPDEFAAGFAKAKESGRIGEYDEGWRHTGG